MSPVGAAITPGRPSTKLHEYQSESAKIRSLSVQPYDQNRFSGDLLQIAEPVTDRRICYGSPR